MDRPPVSRGFKSRRQAPEAARLPPGQYLTTDFPVLSAGPTPDIRVADWKIALQLGGSLLGKWTWDEFEALPQTTIAVDIHCVTKWTKLSTVWQGVSFDDLLKVVGLSEPPNAYVMAHCDGGYTTNLPVTDLVAGKAMIATRYEGLPLAPAHGGPARPPGAASLLLEERKVAAKAPLHAQGRARVLGIAWLSQLWRSLAGAAL